MQAKIVCYFDRFIPLFEENIETLKKSFTFATLQKNICCCFLPWIQSQI